jgi:hypothetical protein
MHIFFNFVYAGCFVICSMLAIAAVYFKRTLQSSTAYSQVGSFQFNN